MAAFWGPWLLWEKMCFVLALSIVVTILLGGCKLVYNSWRLRKYTAMTEARRMHLLEVRRSGNMIQLKGEEVPFGIRAIESGIEVEGVWVSRQATPVKSSLLAGRSSTPSPPSGSSSSELSPTRIPFAAASEISIAMPRPIHPEQNGATNRPRALSSAILDDSLRHSHAGSATPDNERCGPRHHAQMADYTDHLVHHKASLSRLEGFEQIGHRLQSDRASSAPYLDLQPSARKSVAVDRPDIENNQIGKGTLESFSTLNEELNLSYPSKPLQVRYPRSSSQDGQVESVHQSPVDARPFTENRRGNLDALYNHRISHAAETGQLHPRIKRSAFSGDWLGMMQSSSASSEITAGLAHHQSDLRSKSKKKEKDNLQHSDCFSFPQASYTVGRSTSAPPVKGFVPSEKSIDVVQQLEDSYDLNSRPVVTPPGYSKPGPSTSEFIAGPAIPFDFNPDYSHANKTVRKVNSGFEILPAGTFLNPSPHVDRKGRVDRPEEGINELEAVEHKSKRLQKKNPRDSKVRGTSFIEGISTTTT